MDLDHNNEWLLTPLSEKVIGNFVIGWLKQIIPKLTQQSSMIKRITQHHVPPHIMHINSKHHLRSILAKKSKPIKLLSPMVREMQSTK